MDLTSQVQRKKGNELTIDIENTQLFSLQRNEYTEYRGMWCDGYKIVNRSEIIKLVNFAQEHNLNVLSPLVNGHSAGVFYNSEMYPKHTDVRPDFDPLMTLCIEAHKRGIEVHPWIHMLHNRLACQQHPEWAQETSGGAKSSTWINPARPETRQYVVDTVMEMARYPLDGLKMDTIRYGSGSYSYDAYSNQAFAESGYASRAQWQRDQVTELVRMVRVEVNEYKPYLWIGADVWQGYGSWYNGVYQESRRWTAEDLIDYIQIMGYTTSDGSFRGGVDSYVDHKDDNLVNAGPYAFVPGNTAHGSVNTEEEGINHLVDQIEIARDEGADGISIFKYEFLQTHPTYGWALMLNPYAQYARPPIKEQRFPVKQRRWEFNELSMREGWELYPRRNDYPINGLWRINNAVPGTKIESPLIDVTPGNVTTLEFRARNEGRKPVTLSFEWRKGAGMVRDPSAETLTFALPPDNTFHIYSIRLDSVAGWNTNNSRNDVNISNISRIQLSVISGDDPDTIVAFDYIRLVTFPICQKKWLILGPFPNVDYNHAMDINHLRIGDNSSDEFNISINPKPGDIMSGHEWQLFNTSRDYIDYKDIDQAADFNAMYAFSHILADPGGEYDFLVGADDGVKAWINGELVVAEEMTAINSEPNEYVIPINLKSGLNSLLLKVVQESDEFGFFARITDPINQSITDNIKFYPALPEIPTPKPDDFQEGWSISTTPRFRFNLSPANDTPVYFEVSSYWWRVDSGKPNLIIVSEGDRMNGYVEIELPKQSNGTHEFAVRGQDKLGRNGSWGIHEFNIDRAVPSYSLPVPDKTMMIPLESEAGSELVTWKWNVTVMPLSGIAKTEIMVGTKSGKSDIFNNTVPGVVTSFTFPISTDRHEFIYLTAVPMSGAGIKGVPSSSSEGVVIDFTPPERITSMELNILRSADNRSVDAFVISWNPVQDHGVGTGIDHYVLEYSSQNMVEWQILAITSGTDYSYRFVEPKRSERYKFRIHAVDGAGNRGLLSENLAIANLAPSAVISSTKVETGNISTGETIYLTSYESYDPDGEIASYFWNFGDGTFSYRPWAYHTYRYPHEYNLSLTVYDDFGKHNLTLLVLNVTGPHGDKADTGDGAGINKTKEPSDDPGGGNKSNETGAKGDDTESDNKPFSEILTKSMVGYVLIATLLLFILLFGAVFCSNI